jgi:hypothetical protein
VDSSLNFGTGGVPDAEDGDVITHEYTHAISWFLNAAPNMGVERRAMDEAMCDVMAATMSKKYTPFNWRLMFNFDGPNPVAPGASGFWGGRNANSPKTYSDKVNDYYSDSEIWSSTLLDVSEETGNDSLIILMLTSIYSLPQNGNMLQGAQLIMQADSVLFGKYFGWKMGRIFNERGLGNFKTGLREQAAWQGSLRLINTAAFASGEAPASLDLPADALVSVYDIQGRKISEEHLGTAGTVTFDPGQFAAGMYVVKVQVGEAGAGLKLIRN